MCSIYWNIAQRGPSELSSEPSQRKCQGRSKGSWSLSIRYFFFMPLIFSGISTLCLLIFADIHSSSRRADLLRGYAKISQTMTGKDFSRTSSSAQKPFPTCEPFDLIESNLVTYAQKKPLVRNPEVTWAWKRGEGGFSLPFDLSHFLSLLCHGSPFLPSPLPEMANKTNRLAIPPYTKHLAAL